MFERIHKAVLTLVLILALIGGCYITVKVVRFIDRVHLAIDSVEEKFSGVVDKVSGVIERFERRKLFETQPPEVENEP
jgi:hypothetical protein